MTISEALTQVGEKVSGTSIEAAAAAVGPIINPNWKWAREAALFEDEMHQIELIYGKECVVYVRKAISESTAVWRVAVENALFQWTADHPRYELYV